MSAVGREPGGNVEGRAARGALHILDGLPHPAFTKSSWFPLFFLDACSARGRTRTHQCWRLPRPGGPSPSPQGHSVAATPSPPASHSPGREPPLQPSSCSTSLGGSDDDRSETHSTRYLIPGLARGPQEHCCQGGRLPSLLVQCPFGAEGETERQGRGQAPWLAQERSGGLQVLNIGVPLPSSGS